MTILNRQLAQNPAMGAFDIPVHNYGVTALASGIAVALDAANDIATNGSGYGVKLPAASGDICIGVTQEIIPAGASGRVRGFGPISAMVAKGAITAGVAVMAEAATGNVLAATTGKAGVGVALNAASADGDLVEVMQMSAYNG